MTARLRSSTVEDLGDVRMVHQRQRLTFGLEPGDDFPGVHAGLDDFERHLAMHRLELLGHVHHAKSAFPNLLEQLVTSDHRPGALDAVIGF